MDALSIILILLVIGLHLYTVYFEMFAWETVGRRILGKAIPKEAYKSTKVLAANQGLYNLFLVFGLIWSLLIENQEWQQNIALFFLGCVSLAGLYGGFTANKRIFTFQFAPAAIAIFSILIN